ncbi:MAG TPA: hypothetical protein DCG57_04810 [Candidatus Riflebacteria bacterium]|nr:hypothetical protein [Candidatus Riflebacteria bacterium]
MKGILRFQVVNLLCILAICLVFVLPDAVSASNSISEYDLRSKLLREKPNVPHSDKITGHTLVSLNKDWKVGQFNITWPEAQRWIKSLGEGWRSPTRAELKDLFYKGLGLKRQHYKMPSFEDKPSPIGYDSFLAESRSENSAYCFDFTGGYSYSFRSSRRYHGFRAIAVRDKK